MGQNIAKEMFKLATDVSFNNKVNSTLIQEILTEIDKIANIGGFKYETYYELDAISIVEKLGFKVEKISSRYHFENDTYMEISWGHFNELDI